MTGTKKGANFGGKWIVPPSMDHDQFIFLMLTPTCIPTTISTVFLQVKNFLLQECNHPNRKFKTLTSVEAWDHVWKGQIGEVLTALLKTHRKLFDNLTKNKEDENMRSQLINNSKHFVMVGGIRVFLKSSFVEYDLTELKRNLP